MGSLRTRLLGPFVRRAEARLAQRLAETSYEVRHHTDQRFDGIAVQLENLANELAARMDLLDSEAAARGAELRMQLEQLIGDVEGTRLALIDATASATRVLEDLRAAITEAERRPA